MSVTIIEGHCVTVMSEMSPRSVQAIITSPPYWGLRNYGTSPVSWSDEWIGELGQESAVDQYVMHLVEVFRAARSVLAQDATMWVNIGDTYGKGSSAKCLSAVPWRFALAMINDGWILRQDVIWAKPNPMPESVRDRCTRAHEYCFLFALSERYYWDADAMQEPAIHAGAVMKPSGVSSKNAAYVTVGGGGVRSGFVQRGAVTGATRNRRSWWPVAVGHSPDDHYATYPPELIRPMILASTRAGDVVLDPFSGSGTTAIVASSLGRQGVGIELRPEYVEIAERRKSRTNIGLEL